MRMSLSPFRVWSSILPKLSILIWTRSLQRKRFVVTDRGYVLCCIFTHVFTPKQEQSLSEFWLPKTQTQIFHNAWESSWRVSWRQFHANEKVSLSLFCRVVVFFYATWDVGSSTSFQTAWADRKFVAIGLKEVFYLLCCTLWWRFVTSRQPSTAPRRIDMTTNTRHTLGRSKKPCPAFTRVDYGNCCTYNATRDLSK